MMIGCFQPYIFLLLFQTKFSMKRLFTFFLKTISIYFLIKKQHNSEEDIDLEDIFKWPAVLGLFLIVGGVVLVNTYSVSHA